MRPIPRAAINDTDVNRTMKTNANVVARSNNYTLTEITEINHSGDVVVFFLNDKKLEYEPNHGRTHFKHIITKP